MERLLAAGGVEKSVTGVTPLGIACREGHVQLVKLLIEFGADRGKPCDGNMTPLVTAAQFGHREIVKLLLGSGVVPDPKAIERAKQKGHNHILFMLHNYNRVYKAAKNARTTA